MRPCLAALLGALLLLCAPGAAAAQRPNVVVLMTDDQTVESMRAMPSVQGLLAAEGTTFDNSFVSFAVCCPSRATFMTGQYAHNHRVLGLHPPLGGYVKLDTSSYLPTWLQAAGYRTIHLGKFLNGYGTQNPDPAEVPPGFDEWQASVDPSTYDYWRYTLNENGRLVAYGEDGSRSDYQTDLYARRAAALIERHADASVPFFVSVNFIAPHHGGPAEADDPRGLKTPAVAPRHRNAFAAEPLPLPPSFNEPDVSDKPWFIRRRPPIAPEGAAEIQEAYQQRLESLLAVDEAVARIVSTLERTGQLERTLIVFTSDNGFLHGEHRVRFGKLLAYEPSIRVPLIVRGPGVPRGERRRQLVVNADLAPTILEAAGALPRKPQDGRSLFPLLRDPRLEWGRDILIHGRGGGLRFNAVRTSRFVYVRFAGGAHELYDLRYDPFQQQSLHVDPRYATLRRELFRRLRALQRCRGRACGAGPRLALRARPRTGCAPGWIGLRLYGRDRGRVSRAAYFLGRRRLGRRRLVRPARGLVRIARLRPGRRFRLRVLVTLRGDRKVTLKHTGRACQSKRGSRPPASATTLR